MLFRWTVLLSSARMLSKLFSLCQRSIIRACLLRARVVHTEPTEIPRMFSQALQYSRALLWARFSAQRSRVNDVCSLQYRKTRALNMRKLAFIRTMNITDRKGVLICVGGLRRVRADSSLCRFMCHRKDTIFMYYSVKSALACLAESQPCVSYDVKCLGSDAAYSCMLCA